MNAINLILIQKILGELEKLEIKYTFNRKIEERNRSGNILIEKSSELVKVNDERIIKCRKLRKR